MEKHYWVETFPGEVMVCDAAGIVLEMNEGAAQLFKADGGLDLIGQNLLDCHPAAARAKMEAMLKTGEPNTYTTEKHGIKRLFHQIPWYDEDGRFAGFVELSFNLPAEVPNFVRG